ncbi:hypothetical protein NQ317_008040 [Molorchus minor]|uniref:Uncharacterized protein n=1 Tax=Molorchus minor TaxID=1323400 RepID=A0ABQ9JSI1_9CUCU|nr:hypothetical protein NQ317_008040 [Molorchus minor]
MAEELGILKIKRGIVKSMVTRLQNYFNTIDQNNVTEEIVAQLNVRLNKIEPAWEEFNELQSKIELIDTESSQADDHEREQFEEIYFSLTARINTLCKKLNEVTQKEVISNVGSVSGSGAISVGNTNNNYAQSMVKLPTIKLTTFDGSYNNWLEFKDSFTALVEKNESLSDIQKFYYLRSALEKDAVQVIKAIEVSAANVVHPV